ncbi:MAG: 50S ribosomal protein L24e [Candidatus Helarchaeota archaeon]|nr:50S ribosomal protein L24e [Candidatus Helarchaeota archaeon]
MVRIRQCVFCGHDIEPGTGSMYVKLDGTVSFYCTNKCRKNHMKLRRNPRKLKWTKFYRKI